jgi:hypothetical protein
LVGWVTSIPPITTRVNDFWVEYENNPSILFKFINFRCIWKEVKIKQSLCEQSTCYENTLSKDKSSRIRVEVAHSTNINRQLFFVTGIYYP